MTAQRQEDSPLRPGIALIGRLVCLLAGIWLACSGVPAQAATTERIVVNRFSASAKEKIEKAGGTTTIVPGPKPVAEKKKAKKKAAAAK